MIPYIFPDKAGGGERKKLIYPQRKSSWAFKTPQEMECEAHDQKRLATKGKKTLEKCWG